MSTDGHRPGRADVLSVQDLRSGYSKDLDIVRGISLIVRPGQIACVIGPNGSGKSTLVKTLIGLVPVRGGSVRLNGQDITGVRPDQIVERGVGFVPQTENVFPLLSVRENLEVGGGVGGRAARARIGELFDQFPLLAQRRGQDAGSLSGGERQILALARALMPSPSVLLLDEPTAALAPKVAGQVFQAIRSINDSGVSMVLVEQNARAALSFSHLGYVLDGGRIKLSGPAAALLNDPNVIELYLGGLARPPSG